VAAQPEVDDRLRGQHVWPIRLQTERSGVEQGRWNAWEGGQVINEPHDTNHTVDVPADSLDATLATARPGGYQRQSSMPPWRFGDVTFCMTQVLY
jgi:hypothetical protein